MVHINILLSIFHFPITDSKRNLAREAPKNVHHPQCPRRRPLSPHTPCLTLGGDPRLPDHLVGDIGEGGLPPPRTCGGFGAATSPPPGGDREFRAGGSGGGGEGQHAKSRVLEGQVRFCGSLSSEKKPSGPSPSDSPGDGVRAANLQCVLSAQRGLL